MDGPGRGGNYIENYKLKDSDRIIIESILLYETEEC